MLPHLMFEKSVALLALFDRTPHWGAWYIDLDAFFKKKACDESLDQFFSPPAASTMIVGQDHHFINAGVLGFRRSPFTYKFLLDWHDELYTKRFTVFLLYCTCTSKLHVVLHALQVSTSSV